MLLRKLFLSSLFILVLSCAFGKSLHAEENAETVALVPTESVQSSVKKFNDLEALYDAIRTQYPTPRELFDWTQGSIEKREVLAAIQKQIEQLDYELLEFQKENKENSGPYRTEAENSEEKTKQILILKYKLWGYLLLDVYIRSGGPRHQVFPDEPAVTFAKRVSPFLYASGLLGLAAGNGVGALWVLSNLGVRRLSRRLNVDAENPKHPLNVLKVVLDAPATVLIKSADALHAMRYGWWPRRKLRKRIESLRSCNILLTEPTR